MNLASNVKPISYLKSNTADIVKELNDTGEPMLITQNGEPKLILMDVLSYEKTEQAMALLKILALGQKQMENKQYRDADDVFADLEKDDEEN